jgi:DNA topoisomerase-2
VAKLLVERDAKEQELIELLKLSPKDIWYTDLERFLAEWNVSPDCDIADGSSFSKQMSPP